MKTRPTVPTWFRLLLFAKRFQIGFDSTHSDFASESTNKSLINQRSASVPSVLLVLVETRIVATVTKGKRRILTIFDYNVSSRTDGTNAKR